MIEDSRLHHRRAPRGARSFSLIALLLLTVPLEADEPFLRKPADQLSEAESLQILNRSPWAQEITTTVQDSACSAERPAFSTRKPAADAPEAAASSTTPPADGASYVIRFISVKPMQAAAKRFSVINPGLGVNGQMTFIPDSEPTNIRELHYNLSDEIAIAVVLKNAGPQGESFRDYALENGKTFPGKGLKELWRCAELRTSSGTVSAVVAGMGANRNGDISAIELFFPSVVNDRKLITNKNEKVQFRFVAAQRVFDATFVIEPGDLLDGTETELFIPSTVEQPSESASVSAAAN
jgi:hypothetical protein